MKRLAALAIGVAVLSTGSACSNDGRDEPAAKSRPAHGWRRIAATPLSARSASIAVWTGSTALIVSGTGPDNEGLIDGAAYDPAANSWRMIAAPPSAFTTDSTAAVWTGRYLIVWGAVGAAYDPAADHWETLPAAPIPSRHCPAMVWTGTEAIVWGGCDPDSTDGRADGAAYNVASKTWRALAPSPLHSRSAHAAVWTGAEMVVYGGASGDGAGVHGYADAAAYRPDLDQWRLVADPPIPAQRSRVSGRGRARVAAAWTGAEVLLWGGEEIGGTDGNAAFDGALYDPKTDRWREIPAAPLTDRSNVAAVWNGNYLLAWGGDGNNAHNDGAILDLSAMTWAMIPAAPIAGRSQAAVMWARDRMLVWGGRWGGDLRVDGAAFIP